MIEADFMGKKGQAFLIPILTTREPSGIFSLWISKPTPGAPFLFHL